MIHQEQFSLMGPHGKPIYGDLTYDDKNTNVPLLIFVHGFKGFKDWGSHQLVARHFVQNGFRFLKFNFSYAGVSAERPGEISDLDSFADNTFSREMADLEVIIHHAVTYLGVSKVTLIGHSRGGGISILKAARHPHVAALITWSSIVDFRSLWKKQQEEEWRRNGRIHVLNARTGERMPLNIGLLNDYENNQKQLDILEAARQIRIPWLIVHGTDDINVPFDCAQQLSNAQPQSRLLSIKDANHVFGSNHPYAAETLPPALLQVCEKSIRFLTGLI